MLKICSTSNHALGRRGHDLTTNVRGDRKSVCYPFRIIGARTGKGVVGHGISAPHHPGWVVLRTRLLGDPDVLPGRHPEGVVIEVALDLGSVGLGDAAV